MIGVDLSVQVADDRVAVEVQPALEFGCRRLQFSPRRVVGGRDEVSHPLANGKIAALGARRRGPRPVDIAAANFISGIPTAAAPARPVALPRKVRRFCLKVVMAPPVRLHARLNNNSIKGAGVVAALRNVRHVNRKRSPCSGKVSGALFPCAGGTRASSAPSTAREGRRHCR